MGNEQSFQLNVIYSGTELINTFIAPEKIYKGLEIDSRRSISSMLSAEDAFQHGRED